MPTSTETMPTTSTASAHPSLRIYNTLTKKKSPFETVVPGKVGIYLCGPTVYAEAHIGHMVGPVIFDCMKRYLVYNGYDVNWVVNITDVDDKLIQKANDRGITMLEVAEENIADYNRNLVALGVDQIDHFPRATECMGEIIALVESLVEQGFAYVSEGDVYFDVGKDHEYGKLSNRTVDAMQGEGGGTAERKKSAADFALWKSAKQGEPSWDSPWGNGRPGWHIECSAMAKKILGETFDIHGGGLDLVFPHHENEIAQSECCHAKPMVTYWAHNGLLRKDAAGKIGGKSDRPDEAASAAAEEGGKMSRSKGAGGLGDLIASQGGERIRFFLLRTHYRSTVLFSEPAIEEAAIGLETFYRFFKRYERVTGESFFELEAPSTRESGEIEAGASELLAHVVDLRNKFLAAMDDDFNTGGAIGELFELVRALNKYCDDAELELPAKRSGKVEPFVHGVQSLKELSRVLGIFGQPPTEAGGDELLGQVMQLVIDLRAEARAAKNFATADAIRDGLAPTGIVLEDRAGGTEWTGGDENSLDSVVQMLIKLRQTARANKDFATGDAVRDRLSAIGVTLEDRAGGTDWTRA
ncbi:MAG: cysteine--tRNA ligase [Aeoliella sp.]